MKPDPLPTPLRYLEGTDNRALDLVVVVPVARCEWHLAIKLLKWMVALDPEWDYPVVIQCAPGLHESEIIALREASGGRAETHLTHYTDTGYYGGANLSFKSALDHCEHHYPGRAMLWVEADCVPTRAFWVDEILDEYRACGQPFMGDVHLCAVNHMTGNAVWNPNWRTIAPSLADLPGPDPEWGWDTQMADDTFTRCHKARTIQQIWRPTLPITEQWADENIRTSTALFHQDKSGSFIDILCKQQGRSMIDLPKQLEESTYSKGRQTPSPFAAKLTAPERIIAGIRAPGEVASGVAIMVVSYKKEIDFLRYCLRSIEKYATGFSEVVVVVPEHERGSFDWIKRARVVYFKEVPDKGMLSHMVMKCRADEVCPTANFITHIDSDTMLWRNCTPHDFVPNGKALMVRERYAEIKNPNRFLWQKAVENAIGMKPEYEGMVRQGSTYPRDVYGKTRQMVEVHTGMRFDDYVHSGHNHFPQLFCEFNALAAVAIAHFRHRIECVDYDRVRDSKECGVPMGSWQYIYRRNRDPLAETWGHGGIDKYKSDIESWLRGQVPEYFVK